MKNPDKFDLFVQSLLTHLDDDVFLCETTDE